MSPSSPPDRCRVSIARRAGGPAEVHKRATSPARRDRLAREAATLRRARHPGVVDLLELRDEPDGSSVLVTRLAGTHTLATWAHPTLDEIAGVLVVLAETLADLHHLGLAHGAVAPDHVVLDERGRPVLCGFDRTGDPRPSDDIAALGRLTRHLLDADDATAADDRPGRRTSRRQATGRRRLLDLAEQATDPDAPARPGARRFAAAVLTAVPTAALAEPDDPGVAHAPPEPDDPVDPDEPDHAEGPRLTHEAAEAEAPGPDRRGDLARDRAFPPGTGSVIDRPLAGTGDDDVGIATPALAGPGVTTTASTGRASRGARTALTVVGVACLVFGALSAWTGERPELGTATLARPAPTLPPGTVAEAATLGPARPDLPGLGDVADQPPASDRSSATGDAGCDPPVACATVRPGGVIDHAGSRFGLGAADDELLVADPRCPEPPAVALLRPADGAVFLFDRWAEPGQDVAPRSGGTVAPGSHWAPRALDARGCAPLAVLDPAGAVRPLAPAPPEPEPELEPDPDPDPAT